MADARFTEYRGFEVETRETAGAGSFVGACSFFGKTESMNNRVVRMVDGTFPTAEEALRQPLKRQSGLSI
jgi:hypothetical protein